MIYRIAEAADWQLAIDRGAFASADLASEGFIHASELHQVLRTAEKYYRGKAGLVLLEIDDAALGALVVREDLTGKGSRFPHVYGEIPLSAVARHFEISAGASGQFSLPPELVVTKYPGAVG